MRHLVTAFTIKFFFYTFLIVHNDKKSHIRSTTKCFILMSRRLDYTNALFKVALNICM